MVPDTSYFFIAPDFITLYLAAINLFSRAGVIHLFVTDAMNIARCLLL